MGNLAVPSTLAEQARKSHDGGLRFSPVGMAGELSCIATAGSIILYGRVISTLAAALLLASIEQRMFHIRLLLHRLLVRHKRISTASLKHTTLMISFLQRSQLCSPYRSPEDSAPLYYSLILHGP